MKNLVMLCATLMLLVQFLLLPAPAQAATTWGADIRLTNAAGDSFFPMVAVSGSNVHVVWQDERDGNKEIYYKRSLDNGVTWGPDFRLTNETQQSKTPAIAVSGNAVHVVWSDNRTADFQIYYKRSLDNGATWGTDTLVIGSPWGAGDPRVAASGNSVYLVWSATPTGFGVIYFVKSTDGGGTWQTPSALTPDGVSYFRPDIVASGNTLHLAYDRFSLPYIYYRRSLDGGTSWETAILIVDGVVAKYQPSLAVSGQYVNVFWYDNTPGNYEIFYARSTGGGAAGTWAAPFQLTNATGSSGNPRAAVEQMNVHVAWADERDGRNCIFYNYSTNNGAVGTWSTDARLTSNDHYAYNPDLAAATGNVHMVWADDRGSNYEIYYRHGTTPLPAVPTITGVDPARGFWGQSLTAVVTGTNFTGATAVSFGTGIISSFTVDSATQITANISIAPGAASGARDVSVTTPGGSATLTGGFKVLPPISSTGSGSSSSSVSAATSTPTIVPAAISVQSASLSAKAVTPGTPVIVTVDVTNKSAVNGIKKVTLYVNGQVESTQGVTVNSGASSQLTFNVARSEPGDYTVYVDGVPAGSFKVEMVTGNDGILIFSVSLIAIAFLFGLVMLRRRQQRGSQR